MIKAKFSGDCYCLLREYKIYSMLVVWVLSFVWRSQNYCPLKTIWNFIITAQLFQTNSYKSLENDLVVREALAIFFRRKISIIRMVNHAERLVTIYVIITNKYIRSQTMHHSILYLKSTYALYYFFAGET